MGYLTGKAAGRLLDLSVNIPLLFLVSIIPDIDLLIPVLRHRGPTHSIIITILVFLPLATYYGKKTLPYFLAFAQHFLVGDYLTGEGIQLLWPLNSTNYYGPAIEITGLTNAAIEWILLLTSLLVMQKAKDSSLLFQMHSSNLLLSIPTFTVLLPALLSFPQYVPPALIIPHLIYIVIFAVSILTYFKAFLKMN